MKKYIISLPWCFLKILCFLFLLSGISYADTMPQVCHSDNCVTVEVVSKPEDMAQGLMYRPSLEKNKGMLFVFPADGKPAFWMKNMNFNLDIVWISHAGQIVYIGQDVPACRADPCPSYGPDLDARYVLELNSRYTVKHHWKTGDKLDLRGI